MVSNKQQRQRCVDNVLAHYPWRKYRYKYGHWSREQRLWDLLDLFEYKWEKSYEAFQLVDPVSGTPLGVLWPLGLKLAKPGGTLWFAGDPRVAGACRVTDSPDAKVFYTRSRFITQEEGLARASVMRPGDPPGPEAIRHDERLAQDKTPWIADIPNRPHRKWRP